MPRAALEKLLTAANDGIQPHAHEVEWVYRVLRATPHAEVDEVSLSKPLQVTRSDVRAAIALWYPRRFAGRTTHGLRKASAATVGRKRRAAAAQLDLQRTARGCLHV